MRIEYLADYPQYVPTMASWSYQEWGWFTPGNSIHAVEAKFNVHRNRDTLPITFVALEGSEVLGMASLRTHDMDVCTDLTPLARWRLCRSGIQTTRAWPTLGRHGGTESKRAWIQANLSLHL